MKKLAILFFGVFAFSASAQAAVYDFAAQGNFKEQGYLSFNTGTNPDSILPPGLVIGAGGIEHAYFDADTGGLGVCPDLLAGHGTCTPSSNDNHITGETITITSSIDKILGITVIGDHQPVDGAVGSGTVWIDYEIDGGVLGSIDVSGANLTFFSLSAATSFLKYTVRDVGAIYVASLSTVPVPAAVWLFGTAMLGLFGLRRKTKMGALAA